MGTLGTREVKMNTLCYTYLYRCWKELMVLLIGSLGRNEGDVFFTYT